MILIRRKRIVFIVAAARHTVGFKVGFVFFYMHTQNYDTALLACQYFGGD